MIIILALSSGLLYISQELIFFNLRSLSYLKQNVYDYDTINNNTRQEIYLSFISLPSDIMETDLVFLLVYIYMIVISTRYRCKFLFLSSTDK